MTARSARIVALLLEVLLVLLGGAGVAGAIALAVGAHYHPFADGSHLAGQRVTLWLCATFTALVLLVVHAVRKTSARCMAIHQALLLGCTAAAFATLPFLWPQPDRYRITWGDADWSIPRHFAPVLRGPILLMRLCGTEPVGFYAPDCARGEERFTVSTEQDLGRSIWNSAADLAVVDARNGQVTLPVSSSSVAVEKTREGAILRFRQNLSDVVMTTGPTGLISSYASCSYGQCRVERREGGYVVAFSLPADRLADPHASEREARRLLSMLEEFRCGARAACEGATEKAD